MTKNSWRQSMTPRRKLPIAGASTGETPMIRKLMAISRAALWPDCRSRIMARDTAVPAQTPKPCTNLRATSTGADAAKAQAIDISTKRPSPR